MRRAEELMEVLKALGWSELECEELFIQDYDGEALVPAGSCDYTNPAHIADLLHDNDVDLSRDAKKLAAIVEYTGDSLEECIENLDDWDFYEDKTAEEYEEEFVEECYPEIDFDKLGWIGNYITIDYEQMAREDDYVHEVSGGVLVQR